MIKKNSVWTKQKHFLIYEIKFPIGDRGQLWHSQLFEEQL